MRKSFAQRCESIRKDVERTFGIIKKRHMLVDYPVRFRDVRSVEAVFKVCCAMHNMLLHYDGLDTIGKYEEDWKTIDRHLGLTQTPSGPGVVVGKIDVLCCS